MATYYVWSGATGLADGSSWTDAYTTLAAALASATTNGDVIKIHKTSQEAGDHNADAGANISIICVDKDNSDAKSVMGTGGWVGGSSGADFVTFGGGGKNVYVDGVTFRTAGGSVNHHLILGDVSGDHMRFDNCYLWHGTTSSNNLIVLGGFETNGYLELNNCTFRFANTGQGIRAGGNVDINGGSIESAGSAPTTLFQDGGSRRPSNINIQGCDLSHMGTGTLIGDYNQQPIVIKFSNCKLGSGYSVLASQTYANKGGASAYLYDCHTGDTHIYMAYHDGLGSAVVDSSIYFTSGAAQCSWKITTTANATYNTPFTTPWFDYYNSTLSSISPYVEIIRDGSATAYQDDEVWGEFMYKGTTGFPITTWVDDKMTPLGTPADQTNGAGNASWTGEGGTAKSMKLEAGSITPAENGHIRCRIAVGAASVSDLYIDPEIRV